MEVGEQQQTEGVTCLIKSDRHIQYVLISQPLYIYVYIYILLQNNFLRLNSKQKPRQTKDFNM